MIGASQVEAGGGFRIRLAESTTSGTLSQTHNEPWSKLLIYSLIALNKDPIQSPYKEFCLWLIWSLKRSPWEGQQSTKDPPFRSHVSLAKSEYKVLVWPLT